MARAASKHVPVGTKVFGKSKGQLTNLNTWDKHDHGPHWTTANSSGHSIGVRIGQIIDNTIAKEAKEAVKDYAAEAEFGLSVVDGKVYERLRLYNSAASITTQVDLVEQILTTVRDAKKAIHEPANQQMLASLGAGIGKIIHELKRNSVEPEPIEDVSEDDDNASGFQALDQFR